jgi:hypothetical protein
MIWHDPCFETAWEAAAKQICKRRYSELPKQQAIFE